MGGNGSCFVYIRWRWSARLLRALRHQGRPGNPDSGPDQDVGLPLVLGRLFWRAGQVLRISELPAMQQVRIPRRGSAVFVWLPQDHVERA